MEQLYQHIKGKSYFVNFIISILPDWHNKNISPYCNKGWPFYEKFQDIMPNATARGGNVFLAMHAAPPIPLNNTHDNPTMVDGTSTNNSTGTDTLINPGGQIAS